MTSPSDATNHPKPVVEPSPAPADPVTLAPQQRIRPQEILASWALGELHRRFQIISEELLELSDVH
jgi:hypothetical protein